MLSVVSLQSIKERGRYSNTGLSGVFKVGHRVQRSTECTVCVCLYLSTRCKRSASRVCARERETRVPPGKKKTSEPPWREREKEDDAVREKRGRKREMKDGGKGKEEKGEREGGKCRESGIVTVVCMYVYIYVRTCTHTKLHVARARARDRHRDT